MKANRKFVEGEQAVSAVIGVILMVAITVAIAATVYVYVSGMLGTGGASTPNISFTRGTTRLTVSRADAGLKWNEFEASFSNTITAVALYNATGKMVDLNNGQKIGTGDTAFVTAGNYILITGYGTISLRHLPSNSLIGTWEFTQ